MVSARGQVLSAPLTGQPCVLHVTRARVWSRLDFVGLLVSDFTVVAQVAFALETPQGAILIDAEHGNVDGPARSFTPPHHDFLRALLAQRGLDRYVGSTFADHALVAPGDRVTIRGTAVRERALATGEQGYRDEAVRFKLVGYPQRLLEITHIS
jgi:hypothetical protein